MTLPSSTPRRGQGVVKGAKLSAELLTALSKASIYSDNACSEDILASDVLASPRAIVGSTWQSTDGSRATGTCSSLRQSFSTDRASFESDRRPSFENSDWHNISSDYARASLNFSGSGPARPLEAASAETLIALSNLHEGRSVQGTLAAAARALGTQQADSKRCCNQASRSSSLGTAQSAELSEASASVRCCSPESEGGYRSCNSEQNRYRRGQGVVSMQYPSPHVLAAVAEWRESVFAQNESPLKEPSMGMVSLHTLSPVMETASPLRSTHLFQCVSEGCNAPLDTAPSSQEGSATNQEPAETTLETRQKHNSHRCDELTVLSSPTPSVKTVSACSNQSLLLDPQGSGCEPFSREISATVPFSLSNSRSLSVRTSSSRSGYRVSFEDPVASELVSHGHHAVTAAVRQPSALWDAQRAVRDQQHRSMPSVAAAAAAAFFSAPARRKKEMSPLEEEIVRRM